MDSAVFMQIVVDNIPLVIASVVVSGIWLAMIANAIYVGLGTYIFAGRKEFSINPKAEYWFENLAIATWFGGRGDVHRDFAFCFSMAFFGSNIIIIVALVLSKLPLSIVVPLLVIASIVRLAKYTVAQAYKLSDHIKDPNAHKQEK